MTGLKKTIVLAGAMLICTVPVTLFAQNNDSSNRNYETALITTNQVGGNATVGGTVIPYKEITLSAQVPGRITFLAGVEGFRAAEGQALVSIDDDDIQARRSAAVAQIYQAEAALRNAQMQYSRELYSPRVNSITGIPGMGAPALFDQFFTRGFADMGGQTSPELERQADLYAQGTGVSTAQSAVLQAQANLEALDAQLRDTSHLAPFDGIIIQKFVEVGDTVQPGMPLIKFAFTDYLRIVADVPVRLAAGLEVGMIVPARLDSGSGSIQAKVVQIFPVADAQRHTVTVKLDLPFGTQGGPGMYVEVTVPDGSVIARSQAAVPAEALIWRGSLPSVFVLENGQPSLRLLRIGYPLPDGRVSVVSGLNGGETVILNPPADLVSGGN